MTEELVRESVAPARALLEGIGDGVTMTQAGYLPNALVVELNDRFRWYDLLGYKANSEADVIDLQVLHGLLRRAKLLTPRGRKLSVSAKGKQLADDRSLFDTLALATLSGDDAAQDVVRLTAGALLVATGPQSMGQLESIIRPTLDETWRSKSGQTITPRQVTEAVLDWWSTADTFGWQQDSGDWPNDLHELTQTGRAAVANAFRALAAGPRNN